MVTNHEFYQFFNVSFVIFKNEILVLPQHEISTRLRSIVLSLEISLPSSFGIVEIVVWALKMFAGQRNL